MHEISIAESILEIAEEQARAQNARSIQLIKLRLGEFTTIVREALEFAFEIARQGTLAEDAVLEIETVSILVRCAVCDRATQPVVGICLICTVCGFPMEILTGEELQIEYIEVETEEEWIKWKLSQKELPQGQQSESRSRPTS
ncbi:hydrogenase nickel incorporation protein HypA/HybF [Granulicella aggregans]|jgi:hydrogenase nickel incorporation protein HypA/HybF|uniref:Hydrogenase maturation factor HypA n=1 Tax=Granulicella aggregans TaxID=474949 RepID=A0A7W8E638_9BACT|nr:hydrogenase maturation nickel metallochaperone HypA [Granulicella aggregans]MBB5059944.1 hydrogenase nickel incorporation protein HypA/HybF [Granulicella aggregans]